MNSMTTAFRRVDSFVGRHDKYAMQQAFAPKASDLGRLAPVDPLEAANAILSDTYTTDNASRLAKYDAYWRYYTGRHFAVEMANGDYLTPTNYCKIVADKRRDWVIGKGVSLVPDKGNEWVSEALEMVWQSNGKNDLFRKTAQHGMVTGDSFWYFTVGTKDRKGNKLPREKWFIRINAINPAYCYPVWSEESPGKLDACDIQMPFQDRKNNRTNMWTLRMTQDSFEHYINGVSIQKAENPLGLIPMVHIPWNTVSDNVFGTSLLEDVWPLNRRHNELTQAIDKIIKYHAEPTTLVFGVRFSQMERGANKIWSNLPVEGKIETLEMKGLAGLQHFQERLRGIESSIYQIARTPKVCYDSEGLAISNTSGVAMALIFQPLVEASSADQSSLAKGIKQGNEIISAMSREYLGDDLSLLAETPETALDIDCMFTSILPRDEQADLDVLTKKIAMGIMSKAEALKLMGGTKDTSRLAFEIAADKQQSLLENAELNRALTGNPPNLVPTLMGSLMLSEDLVDIATKLGEMASKAAPEPPPVVVQAPAGGK